MTNRPPDDLSTLSSDDQFVRRLVQHKSQLFGFIFAIVQSVPDAEDVFQQTSIVLWEKFSTFDPGTDFVAWACSVAKFKALKLLRSRRRDRLSFSERFLSELADRQTDQADASVERAAALAGCLEKLTETDRELLRRCYRPSVTTKEVAKSMGRPVGAVYTSLSRIRRSLYECIHRSLSTSEGSR